MLNYFLLKMRLSRRTNVYLKKSICRKNSNTIGIRQRQKIRPEIKRNYIRLAQLMPEKNKLFIKDFMEKGHYSLKEGVISISPEIYMKAFDVLESFEVPESFQVSESSKVLENTDVSNTNKNTIRTNNNDNMKCIKQKLAECFVQCDLNHLQIESILSILRSHRCFMNFPKSARTLLQTTRKPISLRKVCSGLYLHIGFKEAIINILQSVPTEIPDKLLIDISTDGASEDRNGRIQIWQL